MPASIAMAATPNFPNRTLYYGDNLPALRRMNTATARLIATDPPFKKQRGFFSAAGGYDDRWTWHKDILGLDRKGNAIAENHDDWIDLMQDDWPAAWKVIDAARAAYGDDMGAFLCWLGVRLMENAPHTAGRRQHLSAHRPHGPRLDQGPDGRHLWPKELRQRNSVVLQIGRRQPQTTLQPQTRHDTVLRQEAATIALIRSRKNPTTGVSSPTDSPA